MGVDDASAPYTATTPPLNNDQQHHHVRAVGTACTKGVEKHPVVDIIGKVTHENLHVVACVFLLPAKGPVEAKLLTI